MSGGCGNNIGCDTVNDCCTEEIDDVDSVSVKCKTKKKKKKNDNISGYNGVCCIKKESNGCITDDDCCGKNQNCIDNVCIQFKDEDNAEYEANGALITDEQADTNTITFLGIDNVDPTIIWVLSALIMSFTILLCIAFYLCVMKKDNSDFEEDHVMEEERQEIQIQKVDDDDEDYQYTQQVTQQYID